MTKLVDISVGADGVLWGVTDGQQLVFSEANAANWRVEGGVRGAQVAVGDKNNVWLVNAEGKIFRRVGEGRWEERSLPANRALDIAVGQQNGVWTTWAVDNYYTLYTWTANTQKWTILPTGKALRVAANNNGAVWCVNGAGELFEWVKDRWVVRLQKTNAIALAIGTDGALWYANANGRLFRRGSDGKWAQDPHASGIQVAVRTQNELYALNANHELWRNLNGGWSRIVLNALPTTGASTSPATGNTTPYTLQRGDTLPLLAQRFGVTVEALQRANPNLNPNVLPVGATIQIPRPGTSVPPSGNTGAFNYVVQAGDTLATIAQKFGVTLEALRAANPTLSNPNLIQVGQVLVIPPRGAANPTPPLQGGGGSTYVVQAGDTLVTIAQKFGVTLEALRAANPQIVNPNLITIGQVLNLPRPATSAPDPASVTPTTGQGGALFNYIVQNGDTLASIAQRFGLTQEAVLRFNPTLTASNLLAVGQVLNLPQSGGNAAATAQIASDAFNYVVQNGDALNVIAQRFGVDLNALLRANPQLNASTLLQVGQVLVIPVRGRAAVAATALPFIAGAAEQAGITPQSVLNYTVQNGDSLMSIARKLGVSVESLLGANPRLSAQNLLHVGMVLAVPQR
jgi:LysM repeat protein